MKFLLKLLRTKKLLPHGLLKPFFFPAFFFLTLTACNSPADFDVESNNSSGDSITSSTFSIWPLSTTLAVNNSTVFSAMGGLPPYTFSVQGTGSGTMNSSTGTYTAPNTFGVYIVKVKDGNDSESSGTVIVNPTLSISPSTENLSLSSFFTFTASGGVSPYFYSILSGGGILSSSSGKYNAITAGISTIQVTDALGNTSQATVTVNSSFLVTATPSTLAVNNSATLSTAGGIGPYNYLIYSGSGSISGTTFTASSTTGTTIIRVTDQGTGAIANLAIAVKSAISLAPNTRTMAVGNNYTFAASGGVPSYTYSVIAGSAYGSVGSSNGVFTATASGNATLQVSDSIGNTATASITINPALAITPAPVTLAMNSYQTFSASGGAGSYSYSVTPITVSGTINSTTGLYQAPSTAGTSMVKVQDSIGNTASSVVTVSPILSISPSSKTVAINNSFTFSATGGTPPYHYIKLSGVGTVDYSSGLYQAPVSTTGTSQIQVIDNASATSTATVTINPALTISPLYYTLSINNYVAFSATGGVPGPGYTYSASGNGSINSTTGVYQAGPSTGTGSVTVTDSIGNTAVATPITVTPVLSLSPSSYTVTVNSTKQFTASGGTGGYIYGSTIGSIDVTGLFHAPISAGVGTLTVTDSYGSSQASTITVNPTLIVSPSSKTLAIGNSFALSVSGGISPYIWALSGTGTLGSTSGSTNTFQASASTGAVTIIVTDTAGNTSSSNITVNNALSISPTSYTLAVGNSKTFTASNGASSYIFSAVKGAINSSGYYVAPATTGTDTITVTDSLSNTATASIVVNAALAISPTVKSLLINDIFSFSSSGGVLAYNYSVLSGSGSITSTTTGTYAAPSSAGTATVKVTDAVGNSSTSAVTISTFSNVDVSQYVSGYSATANTMGMDNSGNLYSVGYGLSASNGRYWLVRKSTDGGSTWSTIDAYQYSATKASVATAFAASSSGVLYVVGNALDSSNYNHWIVRKSTDRGTSWSNLDDYTYNATYINTYASGVAVDSRGNVFVVGYGNNLSGFTYGYDWITRKYNGSSWSNVDVYTNNDSTPLYANSITIDTNGIIWVTGCGTIGGSFTSFSNIRYSTDSGSTWTATSSPTSLSEVSSRCGWTDSTLDSKVYTGLTTFKINTSTNTIYTGGTTYGGSWRTFKSTDSGASWTSIENYRYPSSSNNAVNKGIVIDSHGNIFFSGSAIDTSGIAHWIVRKYINESSTLVTVDDFSYNYGYNSYSNCIFINGLSIFSCGSGDNSLGVSNMIVRSVTVN